MMDPGGQAATPAAREPLAGKRVLVTGAGGFIGSHLVERLVRDGAKVVALSRTRGRLSTGPDRERYAFVACDVTDAPALRTAVTLAAPEILFHFASRADAAEGFEHSHSSVTANLLGTLNTLEAFRLARGRTFFYGDSCKVFGNAPTPYRESTPERPNSSYAIAKSAGWGFCRLYAHLHGFAVVSLRPTLIYGPRQGHNVIGHIVTQLQKGAVEIRLQGGDQTRDPLYIDDAMEAFIAAAEAGPALDGRVLNLGGGRETPVREIAEQVVRIFGSSAAVVCRPSESRNTEIWRCHSDNAEAWTLIRWKPRFTLEQGLERTLEHFAGSLSRRLG